MKWSEKKVSLANTVIIGAVTLAVGLAIGTVVAPNWNKMWEKILPYISTDYKQAAEIDWSSQLNPIYNKLALNYDGDIDKEALVDGAKAGMVDALGDKYTVYMNEEEAEEFQASLHGDVGAGIGVEIGERDGYIRVLRTLPDNPAQKAGILAGDIFYKVDGEEVWELTTDEVAQKVRGEDGSTVKVTMVRDGKELEFELTREAINNVSAYIDYSDDLAIITVTRFDEDTGEVVKKLAEEALGRSVKGVVLDLRGNGGGYTSAARDLLSLWIDGETVLIQKSRHFDDETTSARRGEAILKDMPTVVLTNGTTASASEITAGALKDYGKATLVGEKTYGKGVVQTLIDLYDGSVLKVTTATWYTPKDTSINQTGIEPDIEVGRSFDEINAGKDPQLDRAKKELLK